MVYPSGAARATLVEAMVPPAPGTFSTTTVCPKAWPIGTEIKRATESVGPPAAKGTIKEIDFVGQAFCATADWLASSAPVLTTVSIPVKRDFLNFI
jgi:hypothetical protein